MIRRHSQNMRPAESPKCEATASQLAEKLKAALERHKRAKADA